MKELNNETVDLHVHTNFSDGGLSEQEVFDRLYLAGVKIASICDHNSIDGYKNIENVNLHGIRLIKGIEVDVEFEGQILHILMYNYNSSDENFKNYLQTARNYQIENFKRMMNELTERFGFEFDERARDEFIGKTSYLFRVALNNLLAGGGFAQSAKDAFYMYTKDIDEGKRYAVPVKKFFEMAGSCEAVTVLAHPLRHFENTTKACKNIQALKALGLNGVEVYNNRQTKEQEIELLNFAKANDLLISGGSDFHAKIGAVEKKLLGFALNEPILLKNISKSIIKGENHETN